MDDHTFDQFTKQLATPSTRRVFTTLAGGLVGTVLGLDGLDAAAAKKKCRKPQQGCRKRSQCCGKKKFRCGHSHGGGSVKRTCCGEVGASCPGNALGCCIPLVCTNNKCAKP
jgi:hypothetical protein